MRAPRPLLLLLAGAVACGGTSADAPADPAAPVPFVPPAWYAGAYASLQQCSGLSGDFSRISWYVVQGTRVPDPDPGGYAAAVTFPAEHRIVIASFYASDTVVVRHEMMHDLAQTTTHPLQWFDAWCGNLMP